MVGNFKKRHVERSTTEVVDEDFLFRSRETFSEQAVSVGGAAGGRDGGRVKQIQPERERRCFGIGAITE